MGGKQMKTANLIEDGQIIVQIEYEVGSSEGKNYSVDGYAYLPHGWNMNGDVTDRDFLISFSSNWECETVMSFLGEDYGKEDDDYTASYYQIGSVHGLVNISRAMFMIHYLLEMELTKTDTFMYEEDNKYAKSFNILQDCTIEFK
jgi:hypothetical protein